MERDKGDVIVIISVPLLQTEYLKMLFIFDIRYLFF